MYVLKDYVGKDEYIVKSDVDGIEKIFFSFNKKIYDKTSEKFNSEITVFYLKNIDDLFVKVINSEQYEIFKKN